MTFDDAEQARRRELAAGAPPRAGEWAGESARAIRADELAARAAEVAGETVAAREPYRAPGGELTVGKVAVAAGLTAAAFFVGRWWARRHRRQKMAAAAVAGGEWLDWDVEKITAPASPYARGAIGLASK